MKKLLCLILLPAILLSIFAGCKGSAETPAEDSLATQVQSTEPTESSTDAATSVPTESATTAPTEADTTAPTEGDTTAPTESGSLGVHVDFSAYTPKCSSAGDLYIPGNGQGLPLAQPDSVYPYTGIALRNRFGYVEGYRYGLTDSKGTLVTAPIYSDISILKDDDHTVPFWEVEMIVTNSETNFSELNYTDFETLYGLVSMDGTILIDCKYVYIELWNDRIVCCLPNTYGETLNMDIYDLSGTLLMNTRDFPEISGSVLSSFYGYSDGLYVLAYEPEYNPNYIQDVYYADERGNFIYGPYYDASPFRDGFARISLSDGCETFLKRDGTLFNQTYYYLPRDFSMGRAIIANEEYDNALIDTEGNIIIPICERILPYEDGLFYLVYEDSDLPPHLYDRDGNRVLTYPANISALSKDLYYYNTDTHMVFNTVDGEKSLIFTLGMIDYYDQPQESYIRVLQWSEYGGSTQTLIVSQDLEIVAELEQLPGGGWETLSLVKEDSEGFVIRNGSYVTLYKSPTYPIGTYDVPYFTNAILFPDGTVSFRFQDATELYDKNGNLFFRYTFDSMDD